MLLSLPLLGVAVTVVRLLGLLLDSSLEELTVTVTVVGWTVVLLFFMPLVVVEEHEEPFSHLPARARETERELPVD
mgnify:FL=1